MQTGFDRPFSCNICKREADMPDTRRLLELALKGLEAERAKIDDEIKQIRSQISGNGTSAASSVVPKKRTMSAEARKRISEGMKRRYAELKRAVRSAKK
jgi:hypothetical protein